MTTPSDQIAVSDVSIEIGQVSTFSTSLGFLNGLVVVPQRPGSPNMGSFRNLTFFQNSTQGNCENGNCTNNCNCGNIGGANCFIDGTVNCTNCDGQQWLQSNCNCACTYNCTFAATASYNCNCDCACSKIICTKLFKLGLMDRDIYMADQAFGADLVKTRPDLYNGYRAWAEIVVEWMSGRGPRMMPWMTDEEFSNAAKKWSISWAVDIATPWAEEMAFVMGIKETGSLTGKMITLAGLPVCKVVGVWQRWFGPSKKPAGFGTGLALVVIFVMFKLVAELGRLLEKLSSKLTNIRSAA